jgi:hypothetical protein
LKSTSLNAVASSKAKDKAESKLQDNENAANSSNKSYKVLEFERVIKMSVVDIETLRKLAWNGIPVSIECASTHKYLV